MTDQDDPFSAFGSDRTVIKPSAGRARDASAAVPPGMQSAGGAAPAPAAAAPAAGAPQAPAAATGGVPLGLDALMSASLNPLVSAAGALLVAAPRIRTTARHPNPAALRESLAEGVRKFESQARAQGLPNEQVIAARYVLCTMLDEAAALTPWGGSGAWSAQSLLVQFHNETWGGEKVFQLMARLADNVEANRNLLELLYVAIALGFEGRYRVVDNGRSQLDAVRERLFQMLSASRGNAEPELSPRWQGVATPPRRLADGIPLWVIGAVMLLVLSGLFAILRIHLGTLAQPSFDALAAIDAPPAPAAPVPPPPPPPDRPRLATLLEPQIQAGLVQVSDSADRSVVTIKGDGFFKPASPDIEPAVRSLLPAIAGALNRVPGRVVITGYTDNQPIHTLRYPSNWVLSKDRADAVMQALALSVDPTRMSAQGRGDADPVGDNSTPAGRALNRRVVITLFPQASAQ